MAPPRQIGVNEDTKISYAAGILEGLSWWKNIGEFQVSIFAVLKQFVFVWIELHVIVFSPIDDIR